MNYNVSLETGTGRTADKLYSIRMTIGKENSSGVLASLKQGQQITGTVVSVDQQVTLDFDGQKLTASKDVLKDAVIGDKKTFEVVKASGNELELRLIDNNANTFKKMMKSLVTKDADWNTLQAQKEQSAKQSDKEKQVQDTKSKLEEISSKFTEKDCRTLEQEGFPTENFSVSGLYEAVGRMKSDSIVKDQSNAGNINSGNREDIVSRLVKENLPVTEENIARIKKALELSGAAAKIDDKAMIYLISQEAEPTIENIYKACYSANAKKLALPQTLSEQTWSELEPQVKSVITSAGYDVSQENLKDAKWLLENNLPLTEETFTYKKSLETIQSSSNPDQVLNKIMEGMKDGTLPLEVSLATQSSTDPKQVIADLNTISEESIAYAVQNNSELTIKNLVTIQERLSEIRQNGNTGSSSAEVSRETADSVTTEVSRAAADSATTEGSQAAADSVTAKGGTEAEDTGETAALTDSRLKEIRAQRQLEEIRLKMTLEAVGKLEKKGFSVETQRLEKVVEALKELEDSYYKDLMSEVDTSASELQIQNLKDTTQSLDKLSYMPCSILGNTLSDRYTQTIPGLLTEGIRQQAEYAKAGTAYEALMTVPSSEYGDSLKKAFANADSLLSELNIENTEQNQRAVRILGYNQMEITEESINQVKAYDQEVTTLIQNLHPAVTVRMIKEGQNPLDMPIYELNAEIDRMKEEQGITSEDKFSTYLQKLDKENSITEEERKAYISIYRLLYNVEKSDGAAVGAVIKADREVTLDHLLTAVQTSKKGRLDAVIDDEFGTLQSITRNKESIAEQLSSFTGQSGQQTLEQERKDALVEEQTQYLNRILKQMKNELSPDKLQEVSQKLVETGVSASQNQTIASVPQLSSDSGIWNTLKDVPAEQLLQQLQEAEETQESGEELYTAKVREIRNLCNNSEQALRFLNDFQESCTPTNIMIANHILSNGTSPITKLLKQTDENVIENSENSLKELNELSDKLIDKSSMNEAYEKLEESAKEILSQTYSEEKIDSQRLAELKSIGQQMTFLKTLAKKEFYQIPIETEQGITNMNLTIIRGSETTGKVSVTVGSEALGNIKADFSLKDQALKGFISCDSRSGLEKLQSCAGEIESAAQENGVTVKQLDFGIWRRDSDTYSYQNPETGEQSAATEGNTERILYRLAKAIVQTVQLAENSETA